MRRSLDFARLHRKDCLRCPAGRLLAGHVPTLAIPARPSSIFLDAETFQTGNPCIWAKRRFAVCFKDYEALQPAAQRLVEHLTALGPVHANNGLANVAGKTKVDGPSKFAHNRVIDRR